MAILNPQAKYSPEEKEQVLGTYQERASMRGIKRIFGEYNGPSSTG